MNVNFRKNHILELRDIVKQYDKKTILKSISFNVFAGEFFTIVGPSGCGKTTTLRVINGIATPEQGEVIMENKVINHLKSFQRKINTVFQDYALFDHFNVAENIGYGPKMHGIKAKQYLPWIDQYLALVGLQGYNKKRISQLSGGEKQRVAIARALINRPQVLLLDEPMSALDPKLRYNMQQQLKKIQIKSQKETTFILITHDQDEALMLSDRIMVMDDGKIMQIGTPEEIYNEPESKWVANFFGKSNIIEDGLFVKDHLVAFDQQEFTCLDTNFGQNETRIDILIRPEDIFITEASKGFFPGRVTSAKFRGNHWDIEVKTSNRVFRINSINFAKEGHKVWIRWKKTAIHVMWKEIDD